jgi:hypothetical protein
MANKNFLQLVNRARQECGVSGADLTTLQGQITKEAQRFKNWIDEAWMEVQGAHRDWQWMRKSTSWATVAGRAVYAVGTDIAITDLDEWDTETFRNYVTSVGNRSEVFMSKQDYESWRDLYQYGANRYTQSRPIVFAVTPNKSIGVGPVAADGYTIAADYYARPAHLSADDDTPTVPEQYEMVIIYGAMIQYGLYEVAPEVLARAQAGRERYMRGLANTRLKSMAMGGALA